MTRSLLDRLLTTLDVRLHAFAACEVKTGSRLVFEPMDALVVHFVIAGSGLVQVSGSPDVWIEAGVIVVVPANRGQALVGGSVATRDVDAAQHSSMVVDGLLRFDAADGDTGDLRTICSTISATYGGSFGLFDSVPEPLVENLTALPLVRVAFEALVAERAAPDVGTHALTEALMKQCFVLMIRARLRRGDDQALAFRGLGDRRLNAAVQAVLSRPGGEHTLPSLAAAAGMSRSAFSKAFTETYGETPIAFVQKTRLHHGAQMLAGTDLPVKLVAASVGYASRSHFSRSFRRAYGVDPTAFRDARLRDGLDAPRNDGRSWMDRVADKGGEPAQG